MRTHVVDVGRHRGNRCALNQGPDLAGDPVHALDLEREGRGRGHGGDIEYRHNVVDSARQFEFLSVRRRGAGRRRIHLVRALSPLDDVGHWPAPFYEVLGSYIPPRAPMTSSATA